MGGPATSDNGYYVYYDREAGVPASPRASDPFSCISANDEILHKIGHGWLSTCLTFLQAVREGLPRDKPSWLRFARRVAGTLFQPKVVLMPSPAAVVANNQVVGSSSSAKSLRNSSRRPDQLRRQLNQLDLDWKYLRPFFSIRTPIDSPISSRCADHLQSRRRGTQ